jgi:hypothetical protein
MVWRSGWAKDNSYIHPFNLSVYFDIEYDIPKIDVKCFFS